MKVMKKELAEISLGKEKHGPMNEPRALG